MKHTKGPWTFQKATKSIHHLLYDMPLSKTNIICTMVDNINPENFANANLIAAAPEMYEALKILVSQYEDMPLGGRLTNEGFLKGKAALKKAVGEK